MEAFSNKKICFGERKEKDLSDAFAEFLHLARAIRKKLGNRKYLLDYYILDLFGSFYRCMLNDLWDQADTAGAQIYNLCLQSIRGEEAAKETQIGQQVLAYVESHPHPFLEESTKANLYSAELFSLYLEHVAGQYYCEMEKSMLRNFDTVITDERYLAIVQAIGDKTDMERLDTLIAEQLLRVKPMDVFLQIYMQNFIGSLLSRDIQTDHTILQLLLDLADE